jgi:AAA family ATP:ADP antiporter
MKAQAKDAYSDFSNFGAFTSNITLYTCILASFFSYFLSGNFLRKFGWRFTALITPVALLTFSGFFFFFLFAKYSYLPLSVISALGSSPGFLVILFGSLQNILARSCKFTFFDDTKEMAYIPLPAANKLKGKAAIDGIVSRLGKSGSSIIVQSSIFLFASVAQSLPFFAFFIIVSFIVWGFAIQYLSKHFISKTAAQTISKLQTTAAADESKIRVEENIPT